MSGRSSRSLDRGEDAPGRPDGPLSRFAASDPDAGLSLDLSEARRLLAARAFARTSSSPLVPGNRVELLLDAAENYPAWERAIEGASESVHLEMYIFKDDEAGRRFVQLLCRKAAQGVAVRVLYDWLGALGKTPSRLWRTLRAAGVEVRCCNPPRLDSPTGWLSRDHRKALIVDGRDAWVSGLCIGQDWVGWPERGVEPWRDTGVAIHGPAAAEVANAFAQMWALTGEPLPAEALRAGTEIERAGDQSLRVIASTPDWGGLFRVDLLWAAVARERLWLTDSYFVATPPYLEALADAARGGVDVRLLVPSTSDVQLVAAISRTQYRRLLDAGVRIFEWNGAMLHAKTAVVDGHWARVGSTNLNVASWIGNWELDVIIEDDAFAVQMEETYLADLDRSTEIVQRPGRKLALAAARDRAVQRRRVKPGTARRAAAHALEIGGAFGAALTQRALAPDEARSLEAFALALVGLAFVLIGWPELIAVPLALAAGWLGISLWIRAVRVRRGDE